MSNDIEDQLKTALQLAERFQPLSVQKPSFLDTIKNVFKSATKAVKTHKHQKQTVKVMQAGVPTLEIEIENISTEESLSQESQVSTE